jgi:hypothetical protein
MERDYIADEEVGHHMFMDDNCLLPIGFESFLSNRRKAEADTEPALGGINTGASVSTSTSRPYSSR